MGGQAGPIFQDDFTHFKSTIIQKQIAKEEIKNEPTKVSRSKTVGMPKTFKYEYRTWFQKRANYITSLANISEQ